MPELLYAIVAKDFVVDAHTNNISILSVIEQIGASVSSVRFPELVLLTLWRRNENELGSTLVQRVRLLKPNGEEVFSKDVSFRGDHPRHRLNARMQMLPFDSSGAYVFEISVRADSICVHSDTPNAVDIAKAVRATLEGKIAASGSAA